MRVTNDIKAKIAKEISLSAKFYLDKYEKEFSNEKTRLKTWHDTKINSLKNQVEPVVKNWAKLMKKNYSSYIWENVGNSEELTEKFLDKMFKHSYWDAFPEVTSEKLKNISLNKDNFKEKISLLVTDTCIKAAYIKSIEELDTLIQDAKNKVATYYAH